jgi:hypothetical protein
MASRTAGSSSSSTNSYINIVLDSSRGGLSCTERLILEVSRLIVLRAASAAAAEKAAAAAAAERAAVTS